MKKAFAMTAAAAVVAAGASFASADVVNIFGDTGNSTENLGNFEGFVQYDFLGGSSGLLTISLTNTSDLDNGGFITAFLFNMDSSDAVASLSSATYDFDQATGNGLNGSPFGDPYDAGAGINGSFEGGGNPNQGIAIGDTGLFTFDISASDASSLSALSFMTGAYDFNFLVRFRGFEDGGSDKVPAAPAPGALALLGAAGLVAGGRRRRA